MLIYQYMLMIHQILNSAHDWNRSQQTKEKKSIINSYKQ